MHNLRCHVVSELFGPEPRTLDYPGYYITYKKAKWIGTCYTPLGTQDVYAEEDARSYYPPQRTVIDNRVQHTWCKYCHTEEYFYTYRGSIPDVKFKILNDEEIMEISNCPWTSGQCKSCMFYFCEKEGSLELKTILLKYSVSLDTHKTWIELLNRMWCVAKFLDKELISNPPVENSIWLWHQKDSKIPNENEKLAIVGAATSAANEKSEEEERYSSNGSSYGEADKKENNIAKLVKEWSCAIQ